MDCPARFLGIAEQMIRCQGARKLVNICNDLLENNLERAAIV